MQTYLAWQVAVLHCWEEQTTAHRENIWDKPSLLTRSFVATQQSDLKSAQINRKASTSFQIRLTEYTNLGFKALCWQTHRWHCQVLFLGTPTNYNKTRRQSLLKSQSRHSLMCNSAWKYMEKKWRIGNANFLLSMRVLEVRYDFCSHTQKQFC